MILKLAEKARRYETEEEKVLPFYACSLTHDEQEDVTSAEMETPMEALAAVSHILRHHIISASVIFSLLSASSRQQTGHTRKMGGSSL